MAKQILQTHAAGRGEPAVVLVGGGLTGWRSWEPHQERLASSRRVIRVQPLSVQYGLESRPLPAYYGVRLESDALARALPADAVDLVGWSYGGLIALDFALGHRERVRTLTLIEPPAMWVLDALDRWDDRSREEDAALHALHVSMRGGEVTTEQLAAFVRSVGLVPPGARPEDLPAWPTWVEHRRSLLIGDVEWRHHDDAARLRGFDRPALLVRGTGSTHTLHRILDALADALPDAQSIELPGGHAPQLVAIDEFLDRLAAFLAAR